MIDVPAVGEEAVVFVRFEERSGSWQTHYYQHNAIENALEAVATGKQRVLATLVPGTGKAAIAFQLAKVRTLVSFLPDPDAAKCLAPHLADRER